MPLMIRATDDGNMRSVDDFPGVVGVGVREEGPFWLISPTMNNPNPTETPKPGQLGTTVRHGKVDDDVFDAFEPAEIFDAASDPITLLALVQSAESAAKDLVGLMLERAAYETAKAAVDWLEQSRDVFASRVIALDFPVGD